MTSIATRAADLRDGYTVVFHGKPCTVENFYKRDGMAHFGLRDSDGHLYLVGLDDEDDPGILE